MLDRGMYIADRYEIVERIGTGGMSDVYKAMDHKLGRYVAIKVLKAEFSEDMTFVTKFRTEAQSAARLEHPNIVNIYDVGSENGLYYIVMEHVEGITLKTYIEKKGRLNYKETLSIAIQVGRGIQAAHAKNIIHRDIKPQNIIISTDGKVKVTDFGIARAVSEHTIHSDVMGSVHYVSPEQARNGYVSTRSDIYSLGIVMYEMVTGRVPFDGDSTVSVAIQHLQEEMVPPHVYAEDVPISLEKIILKCTQKSPDRRYDSMDSLLIDLRKALVTPNEDFVTLVPFAQDKTRVLSEDEVREIQERTAGVRPEKPKRKKEETVRDTYEEEDEDEEEEDEDEGGFLNPRMEKVVGIMRIVVAIVIVILVVYLLGSFFGVFRFGSGSSGKTPGQQQEVSSAQEEEDPGSSPEEDPGSSPEEDPDQGQPDEPETVTMIDLRGMTPGEARDTLKEKNLDVSVREGETDFSDEYEEGLIMAQSVAEGETLEAGSEVEVTVSSGPEEKEIEIPDVVGDESDSAMKELEDAGFAPKREFQYDNDVAPGQVISQDPKGGTKGLSGDSVTLYVSQGAEAVKVPGVVGMTEEKAKSALEKAGLKTEVSSEYSDTAAEGEVIDQSVDADKFADKGSTVKLTVSLGPEIINYYYKANIKAPSNVEIEYADIELVSSDTGEVLDSWNDVTDFPYQINVTDIEDSTSGMLSITWYYTDESGTLQHSLDEKQVNFKKQ